MTQKKKNNIIIGSLCAVVLLMVVGYAAFSSVLNIKGTSSISSNWSIKITKIEEKNIVGGAETATNEAGEKKITGIGTLTASFETNLVSPGDSIEYDITVSNEGSLNAKLDKITLTDSNNPAIKFTSSGLVEGSELNAGDNAVLTVKVEYLDSVTSQPDNTKGTLTVTLDYSQKEGSSVPINPIKPTDLVSNVVTEGDGLYADEYESGRYIYRGTNPNNYINIETKTGTELYRIISIESDGTVKIVKVSNIGDNSFDPGYGASLSGVSDSNSVVGTRWSSSTTDYCYASKESNYFGCNVWGSKTTMLDSAGNNITKMPRKSGSSTVYDLPEKEAYINTYLNNEYYDTLSDKTKAIIDNHIWNVGILDFSYKSLNESLSEESMYHWRGKVGLINLTDYVKSNTNPDGLCGNIYSNRYYDGSHYETCRQTTWLYNKITYWTMTPYSYDYPSNEGYIGKNGNVSYGYTFGYTTGVADYGQGVLPTLYLIPNITLSGEGTANNPYTIN